MTMRREPPLSSENASGAAATERRTTRWTWAVAMLVMLATLVPYLIGAGNAQGRYFTWLGDNLIDSTVYLAWMRQAAEGHLRVTDLFTTEAQRGMLINPFFLVLGYVARFTGLPLIAVYHLARLVCGFGLLLVVWKFIRETIAEPTARTLAFLFTCFSAGFAWIPFWWNLTTIQAPIDRWQDEGFTFRSLYFSPLFCISLLLQVAVFLFLLQADRSRRVKFAISAGVCGLMLVLIHPYNIVSEALVWGVYLVLNLILPPRPVESVEPGTQLPIPDTQPPPPILDFDRRTALRNALLAGAITLPGLLYMVWQLRRNPIFQATRPQEPSVSPVWVALGYGLTLLLALLAAVLLLRQPSRESNSPAPLRSFAFLRGPFTTGPDATRLLIVWMAVNSAAAYLPVSFQRRVLQGTHFPIALLASVGTAWLLARWGKPMAYAAYALAGVGLFYLALTWGWGTGAQFLLLAGFWLLCYLEKQAASVNALRAGVALTCFLGLTNLRFLHSEVEFFQASSDSYLKAGEIDALQWIRDHAPPDAIVQPISIVTADNGVIRLTNQLARFVPEMTGRPVFYGHEAETIHFLEKQQAVTLSCSAQATEEQRVAFWRTTGIRYLIFAQREPDDIPADQIFPMFRGLVALSPRLTLVHHNPDADVYEIHVAP